MNGWILEDDEEEEEEEDTEIEEEIEEENDDDDDAEVINPYEEADPLNLPLPDSDTESEDTAVAPTPDDHEQEAEANTVGTITRVPYSVRPFSGNRLCGIGDLLSGPFKMGMLIQTPTEETEDALQLGQERAKVFTDLSAEEKERESQLYDEFEHFRQIKGETIHVYYVRFTKLINDMRNIKMTMPRMQLNSKFVNNMLPEWSRFITEVKLNRGLKESNFDQLYAYLKQHEVHASENRMMMERFIQPTNDPLALVSNASVQ
ncbi:hypothetical protein Tco_0351535 [Tanacetum coccineum]